MSGSGGSSRRGFFKRLGAFLAVAAFESKRATAKGLLSRRPNKRRRSYEGIVALAKDKSYSRKSPDKSRSVVLKMLNDSLLKITGKDTQKDAWSLVAKKGEVIGIKLNCIAAPNLSPMKELVGAVVEGLKSCGVKENDIIVFDRSAREIERGGFEINSSGLGVRYMGTDTLSRPYASKLELSGSIGSLFSNILVKKCDALINIGVLKDHSLSGVGAGMKNFYGVIHNPNKYHDSNCNPYIADLCNHRFIRDKLRLTVIDASTCQYDGGPGYDPSNTVEYNSILTGFDPVAVDRIAHYTINEKRKENGLKSLEDDKRPPLFIDTAGKLGLGQGDPTKIKLIKL